MTPIPLLLRRALAAARLPLIAALLVAGCGGGVGTGGTGGFAAGPITGFGSVIVGGVRFDDTTAAVEDGDGTRRSRDELRLGMTVEIDSGAIASDATATATQIRFESELAGLVGLIDLTDSSFTLLGQRVQIDDTTVFDERLDGTLAALRTGQALEVYAVFDPASGRYRATRLEPASALTGLRLRGPVGQLDAAAQVLTVGGQSYSYAGATGVPAGLAAGQFVRLRLALATQPTLRWVVQSFGVALRSLPEADRVELEGRVSAFSSSTSFSVNGRMVDARGATVTGAGLALGARVEVTGNIRAGVLLASAVKVVSDSEASDREFELNGLITAVSTAQATITVRGVTISTARSDLRFQDGSAADLTTGRNVEVKAVLGADRRTLEATRIRFR
jgi:hypothetical protein